jgi:hypothetical protein
MRIFSALFIFCAFIFAKASANAQAIVQDHHWPNVSDMSDLNKAYESNEIKLSQGDQLHTVTLGSQTVDGKKYYYFAFPKVELGQNIAKPPSKLNGSLNALTDKLIQKNGVTITYWFKPSKLPPLANPNQIPVLAEYGKGASGSVKPCFLFSHSFQRNMRGVNTDDRYGNMTFDTQFSEGRDSWWSTSVSAGRMDADKWYFIAQSFKTAAQERIVQTYFCNADGTHANLSSETLACNFNLDELKGSYLSFGKHPSYDNWYEGWMNDISIYYQAIDGKDLKSLCTPSALHKLNP